jgi:hypothetical protein
LPESPRGPGAPVGPGSPSLPFSPWFLMEMLPWLQILFARIFF